MDKSFGMGSSGEKLIPLKKHPSSGGKIMKNAKKKPEIKNSQKWRDEIMAQFQQDSIQSSLHSD